MTLMLLSSWYSWLYSHKSFHRASPCEQSGGDTWDLGKLDHCDVCLALSWIFCSKRSQLPCCEDTQPVLWKGLYGEKPRPTINSQPYMWTMYMNMSLCGGWFSGLQSSLPVTGAPLTDDGNCVRDLQARTANQATPQFLINRNWGRQKCMLFY